MNRWTQNALAVTLAAMVGLTGCKNSNLFGKLHKSGDSGDVATLQSDTDVALSQRDYSRALEYAQRILDQDPNNSKALYSKAAAALGLAALDLGTVISNVFADTTAASSITSLNSLVAASRVAVSASSVDVNSLLAGINIDALIRWLPTAEDSLRLIIERLTDGVIPSTSVNVRLNYAVVLLLNAAAIGIDANIFDIVNTSGNYTIVKGSGFSSACSDAATVKKIGSRIAVSYYYFSQVASDLNLGNDKIIPRLRDDVKSVADEVLTSGGPNALPQQCLDDLSAAGIDVNTYQTYSGPLL